MAVKTPAKTLQGKASIIKRKMTAKKAPRASTVKRTPKLSKLRAGAMWSKEDAAFFQPYADKLKAAGL